ncbi:sensor histidine kinase [Ningiella sp. W23]|uniref:sensor histidine kinase n=1 Tax=Ningiella sp. W23 TaxID=3023715 RepID=UPI003757ADFC
MIKSILSQLNHSQQAMPRLGDGERRKWSYTPLLFTIFYFAPVFFAPSYDLTAVAVISALYVLFLCLYLWTLSAKNPILGLVLLFGVISASIVLNPGGFTLYGYCVFVMAFYFERRQAFMGVLVLLAVAIVLQFMYWQGAWILFAQCLLVSAGLFGFGMMERKETLHRAAQLQSKEEIQQLSKIAERERIGRDLHDVAGHALSTISVKAQLAAKLLDAKQLDKAQKEVRELAEISKDLLSEIRQTVSGIKQLTFSEELEKIIQVARERNIEVIRNFAPDVMQQIRGLSAFVQNQLSLVCMEAMTNVSRHSNASRVQISLRVLPAPEPSSSTTQFLMMSIADNGLAHNASYRAESSADNNAPCSSGNGLKGIRERVKSMQGEVDFVSEQGFTVKVRIPIEYSREQVPVSTK